MKKRLAIFCVLALSMSLLSGCMHGVVAVSYTHLTLPTILLV